MLLLKISLRNVPITSGSPERPLFAGLCGLRREERFAKGYHVSNGQGLTKMVLLMVVEKILAS